MNERESTPRPLRGQRAVVRRRAVIAYDAALLDLAKALTFGRCPEASHETPGLSGDSDVLVGGAGNDLVIGGEGRNLMVGGFGSNHAAVAQLAMDPSGQTDWDIRDGVQAEERPD